MVALLGFCAVLLCIRLTMSHWVKPESVKASTVILQSIDKKEETSEPVSNVNSTNKLKNINTADSLDLIALKGIGKGLSHRILERRRQVGRFDNWEQVFEVYHFKQETKELLKSNFRIE